LNLRPVAIVYRKDLRDLLRDWRTLLSIVIVPVIIAPGLILGVLAIVGMTMKQAPKVMLLGGEGSPETVAALRKLENINLVPADPDYTNLISNKKVRAAVEIPKDFDAAVEKEQKATIRLYIYEGEPKSMLAAQKLEEFFHTRRQEMVRRRLVERTLPETLVTPFDVQRTNVASPQQVSGLIIGMVLPYMMIVMCLAGAIHPAVDLTAGEKERGTLETLLCSPVPRTHLVLGKVLVVLTVSLATAALSVGSNGTALLFLKSGALARLSLTLDPMALAGVCAMMIPLAVFLSALAVAVGLFARSSKEANTYLQPMLLFAIIPAIIGALPGVEFNYGLAFVPVVNLSLLSKELLTGTCHWSHVLLVFGSMTIYAGLAVAAAVALFKRESVLFRT
jgi:sodium transport system permease protein